MANVKDGDTTEAEEGTRVGGEGSLAAELLKEGRLEMGRSRPAKRDPPGMVVESGEGDGRPGRA